MQLFAPQLRSCYPQNHLPSGLEVISFNEVAWPKTRLHNMYNSLCIILCNFNYLYFQELLFCETCDTVFCTLCTGGTHKSSLVTSTGSPTHSGGTDSGNNSPTHQNNASSTADHTVIPFSIAIKRMSEILIYKANECTAKLDAATEIVNAEIHRFDP